MTNETNVEFGKCSLNENETEITSELNDEEKPIDHGDIRTGNVYFGEHHADTIHLPFMLAPSNMDTKKIIQKMCDEWKMFTPRIIIIAIAVTENFAYEEYKTHSRKLVKGLLHALNTTDMWLCTDGSNNGFSRDIGTAYENELSRRKTVEKSLQNTKSAFPKAALIGICRRQNLNFSKKLGPLKTPDSEETEIKRSINKNHDYCIFIDDNSDTKNGVSHFLLNFASHMKTIEDFDESKLFLTKSETPVMFLLLQGKIIQIDFILGIIKRGIPLVVFEGSGGLADLIAYGYLQLAYRPEGINEAEYAESVIKPKLSDKMREMHPNFLDYKISFFTEQIFDCIRYAKQGDQEFITVLDLTDVAISTSSFSSYLLKAYFKSEPSDVAKDIKQMEKDLNLTMDWNSPVLAREKVFDRDTAGRYKIDEEMFYRALTKPHREEFVSLFISQGFSIHSYLDNKSLLQLFQSSLKRDFFRGVVWESILGFGTSSDIPREFMRAITVLIEELTGIASLINPAELDWFSRAIYDQHTSEEAERKAVNTLVLWAILSYRVQLVKAIWRHSEQPIHLALVCSIILKKLETYVTDLSVINEMEKQSKEFSEMAASVMTLCYDCVPCRAIDLLKERSYIWSNIALMELAAFAKNKQFLAHPSCQKYLDNIFMGYIKVKDLPYGDVTMPLWLKITLSAFLVFPIFLWIRFEVPNQTITDDDKSTKKTESDNTAKEQDQLSTTETKSQVSFLSKLYYFYSAPITKFWVCQVFYLLFLILFSTAVIWPSCGNIFLDFFTCLWLSTIIIDAIYNVYTLSTKFKSMPLMYKCLEISLMILFLCGYIAARIVWQNDFTTPYTSKVMLCLALLYFYYRLIFISLPISSELGPMLYRVRRMTSVDFLSYMRVTILVIISNGIAIHAVVFPDYPLNAELIRRAFFDAITAFFLMPIDAYVGTPDPKCTRLKRHPNKMSFVGFPEDTCKVGRYFKPECPNPGLWPYLFGLQYMILLRLILGVMLFALFSNTTRKLEEEGKYIWKYQRYQLVVNFANRLTLPPPLSILTLIYLPIKYLLQQSCLDRYIKYFISESKTQSQETLNENDFRFWKNLAMQYFKQKKREKAEEITTRKRMEHIDAVSDDLNKQRKALLNLEGHLNELQLLIINSHQYLKDTGLQVSVRERLKAKNIPQIFSRISPYPNTVVSRYPVPDNHVTWKINWTTYDPISFTLPKEDYPAILHPRVDVDIQRKREIEGESFRMPNFNWNKVTVSPGGVSFDRESWITDKSGHTFEYEIDTEGLPKNPLGRTGLKGRGSLPRWGPNHHIYVVITQILHEKEEQITPKYIDIIFVRKNGRFTLPGGYVYTENRYEIIKSLFDTEEKWENSDNMIHFFESLVESKTSGRKSSIWEKKEKNDKARNECTVEKVKLGYMDEETNTDQAWCEAEVWHIHYNTQNNVKMKFKVEADWHFLTYESLQKVPGGQASIIHTIAKKMKAFLEVMQLKE